MNSYYEGVSLPLIHEHLMMPWNGIRKGDCCGGFSDGYYCERCDFFVHKKCSDEASESINKVEHPLEVNHCYHSLHPLKLLTGQPPEYSDGKCRLCGRNVDKQFYHCSSCNFTLDMHCVLKPPPQSLLDLKSHDHQLTLLPRLHPFKCNACGLSGDRSPYICVLCDFMIHQDCLGFPGMIRINRHDHPISRTSVLGVVNSVCGVCRRSVDWTCGGYSCQSCPGYVVHSKCATREDVWNGKELEGVPEEIEDIEPYVVIDENIIQHFSHKEHSYLRLKVNGYLWEEYKRCSACTYPIGLQSFYGCLDCDFTLHQNCAELPERKWHGVHTDQLTLVTSGTNAFLCAACRRMSNGFMYQHGNMKLDVRCGSISEPFLHLGHPSHPLFYTPQGEVEVCNEYEICNGCNKNAFHALKCTEDGCEFVLCFKCATLPQVVKLDDAPLLLCYGEEASGKHWCDVCEKETNPKTWFYKDYPASLHTECVVGDFAGLMPRSTIEYLGISFEVVLNNSTTRPFCKGCESRCIYPIILKLVGTSDAYFCSDKCVCDIYVKA